MWEAGSSGGRYAEIMQRALVSLLADIPKLLAAF